MDTIYEYNNKRYRILEDSKMKIGEKWIDVTIYECLYENPDGMVWVRESEQFYKLFKPIV